MRRLLAWIPLVCLLSCSTEPKKRAFESEQSSEGPTATVKPSMGEPRLLGDVPAMPKPDAGEPRPAVLPRLGLWGPEVAGVMRASIVDIGASPPPIAGGATLVHYVAGGPPFGRFTTNARELGGSAMIADVLLDRERLSSWLKLGADLARASRFTYFTVVLKTGVDVRLIEAERPLAPAHWRTPKTVPPGLEGLACAELVGDDCAEVTPAVAKLSRVGLIAYGDLRDLRVLAAEDGQRWAGASFATSPVLSEDALRGRDVEVWSASETLGPIELALGETETANPYRAELERRGVIAFTGLASSYMGPLSYVARAKSEEDAQALADSFGKLRSALAGQSARPGRDVDDAYNVALQSSLARAIANGKVATKGSELRLEAEVALNASEQAALDAYAKLRGARYAALARVLEAAMADKPLPRADLLELGGEELAAAVETRRKRQPRAVPTTPLRKHPQILVPVGAKDLGDLLGGVQLRWPDGGAERIDDVLDALRVQGFTLSPTMLSKFSTDWRATKGATRVDVRFRKTEGVDAIFVVREP